MRHLAIIIALLTSTLHAQTLKVLESNLHMENDQLKSGIVIDERVPRSNIGCWHSLETHPDSAEVYTYMRDPQTDEYLEFFAVYAVHRTGSDIVIDSLLGGNFNTDKQINVRIAARKHQLLVWQTAGYRPVLMEYSPLVDPEVKESTVQEFESLAIDSTDGYSVKQEVLADGRAAWYVSRTEGFEYDDRWPMVHNSPADEFRWSSGGWLHFRIGNRYFKLHAEIPLKHNCRMTDIEISQNEFAAARKDGYNRPRSERRYTTADSLTIKFFENKWGLPLNTEYSGEDAFLYRFEHGPDIVEIAVGDYCCTVLQGDTVEMETCDMALSVEGDLLGGTLYNEGGGLGSPCYVYVYPLLDNMTRVGTPYIYQTTPEWLSSWEDIFWGEGGWLYVQGYDSNGKTVYHKLHL